MADHLTWYYIPAAIISLSALCIWEWLQEAPFIDVKLLVNKPSLSMVYIRGLTTSYVLYLLLYGLPQWLEGVKHLIPLHTGLSYAAQLAYCYYRRPTYRKNRQV
jgi:hypothetical protein